MSHPTTSKRSIPYSFIYSNNPFKNAATANTNATNQSKKVESLPEEDARVLGGWCCGGVFEVEGWRKGLDGDRIEELWWVMVRGTYMRP